MSHSTASLVFMAAVFRSAATRLDHSDSSVLSAMSSISGEGESSVSNTVSLSAAASGLTPGLCREPISWPFHEQGDTVVPGSHRTSSH